LLPLHVFLLFSGLSLEDNKLLDMFPKHQLFYMMGGAYGVLFTVMGLMLMHPTIGLPNTKADPSRWLGWVSYVTIEVNPCFSYLLSVSSLLSFLIHSVSDICIGISITVCISLSPPYAVVPYCLDESYPPRVPSPARSNKLHRATSKPDLCASPHPSM
jgi:hypothetical protein